MFNKIRNLFKKKVERLPEDAEKTKKRLIGRLHGTPVYVSGEYTNTTLVFPKLTRTELIALHSCIEFAIHDQQVKLEAVVRPAMAMKSLVDKGYLVRVRRGLYQISFKK